MTLEKGLTPAAEEIYARIPHRPPFLWVDRIVSLGKDEIETEKEIPNDLDIFAGHYPEHPLMPGVLLCEAAFQTGAILMSEVVSLDSGAERKVPVLTRIVSAKFKREVHPGDTIRMQVKVTDSVGSAWFMKGKVLVRGKVAVRLEFACMLT